MVWPSSEISKILCILLIVVVIYCILMDSLLYIRIKMYPLDDFDYSDVTTDKGKPLTNKTILKTRYEDVTWVSCSFNPLCYPTVKGLMIDHINHYIYGPLCAIVDIAAGISGNMLFLTPNMITYSHVFIALIAAKTMTSNSLYTRRIGVVLHQIGSFLDDLDGHVARERKHVKGHRTEVGSTGYWIDGLSDMVGVVVLMIGIFIYLKNNPPRRGYKGTTSNTSPYYQLKDINTSEDKYNTDTPEVAISYKSMVPFQRMFLVIGLFCIQMLLSSLAWNRYLDLYQQLLETGTNLNIESRKKVFRSGIFYVTTGLWRLVNPHRYTHILCLAVYCDKTWMMLSVVHIKGYFFLVFVIIFSEIFVTNLCADGNIL